MNKTREASPLSRRLKQTGKNRDTDSHMKPLKGSRFLWRGGALRTALGSWRNVDKKSGWRLVHSDGQLGFTRRTYKGRWNWRGGDSSKAYCMCKGPEYLYLGKTFHINKFSS